MPPWSNPCHPITASGLCASALGPFTSANLGEADVMVYLGHDTSGDWQQGIAALGTACNDQSWARPRKLSINEYQESESYFGGVSLLLLRILSPSC